MMIPNFLLETCVKNFNLFLHKPKLLFNFSPVRSAFRHVIRHSRSSMKHVIYEKKFKCEKGLSTYVSNFSRLCDYFSNTDVENIKDKKDKIQPRLFCKLILSLGEVEPDEKKNHYATIATLFRCGRCCKLISRSNASQILCKPQFMKLTTMGKIINMHTR